MNFNCSIYSLAQIMISNYLCYLQIAICSFASWVPSSSFFFFKYVDVCSWFFSFFCYLLFLLDSNFPFFILHSVPSMLLMPSLFITILILITRRWFPLFEIVNRVNILYVVTCWDNMRQRSVYLACLFHLFPCFFFLYTEILTVAIFFLWVRLDKL